MSALFKKCNLILILILSCNFYAQEKPNIIVILTDDMGYGDISAFNSEYMKTPNVDRIAEQGTKFTQYYTAAPICSPSRVGVLTGMYPANWNFTTFLNDRKSNLEAEQANYLNTEAPSIASIFKEAGYATGHFGKWHMGGGRDVQNAPGFENYGFDEHVSTYESPDPDPLITATDWIWSPEDSIKRWDRTRYFVDKTLAFLKKNKGKKPSFINLWPDDMHTPWVPEVQERYTGKFPMNPREEKAFTMVLEEYDRQMGRLLDGIKEMGIEDNTIIIFTSDNGPLPSFRGSRAAGLRGTKLSLYEGGIRMPFIIKWPGHVPAGETNSTTVISATDLLPSLAAMADVELPANYKGDGEDVHSAFLGKKITREGDIFWEYGRNPYAFNYPKGRDKSPNLAIRSGKWKLLVDYHENNVELYDMEKDKFETKNVAKDHPDIVKELKTKLVTWRMYMPTLTPERMNPK